MQTFVKSIEDVFDRSVPATSESAITGGSFQLADGSVVGFGDRMVEIAELIRESVLADRVAHVEIDEQLVSPERAGELLGVSRPTVYAWQDRGKLGRVENANQRSVPLADVEALRMAREAKRVKAKQALELLAAPATAEELVAPSLFETEAQAEGSWAHALVTGGPVTRTRRRARD